MTVAVLGLGTMGSGMARSLLRAGIYVRAYNRTHSRAEPLAELGAVVCATAQSAASGADIIIAMLADDVASRETWTGHEGALLAAKPDAVLVEASTVSPVWIAELAALAQDRGLTLLDAPVTGSRVQAEGGQLNFWVGGEAGSLEHARPALEAMGRRVIHLGPVGSGARLKLINNFLCGVQVASLAEALAWIERSALDRDQALDLLKNGAPGSPLVRALSDRMAGSDYDVNFLLRLMAKDLSYAQNEAGIAGVDLRSAAAALSRFQDAVQAGLAEADMAAVIEPLRRPQGD